MHFILEIAAFTLHGAIEAYKTGAHRIELCDNPSDGGTTPSYGMMVEAKKNIRIPIFPIIRPRGGNFVYSKEEIESIKNDIELCKELKFEGIVIGCLNENGEIAIALMNKLVQLAFPMNVTFHRAFDRTADPLIALEQIIDSGCKRILTSGQYSTVTDGKDNLKKLIEKADNRIIIMPGSGLNSQNIREIATYTKAKEFHTAARISQYDKNIFSPPTMNGSLSYTTVNRDEIKSILDELEFLKKNLNKT